MNGNRLFILTYRRLIIRLAITDSFCHKSKKAVTEKRQGLKKMMDAARYHTKSCLGKGNTLILFMFVTHKTGFFFPLPLKKRLPI